MRKIYIIRHCKQLHADDGKCISQTDFPLSNVGLEQANALAMWKVNHPNLKIYTSPLKRCTETASFISRRKPVAIAPKLTEISVGDWEGIGFSEIKTKWPNEYSMRGKHIGTVAPPNGESFEQAGNRLDAFLREILKETDRDILIVTHAGVLRGWLCKISEISADRVFDFLLPYGSITEIDWDGNQFYVKKVGQKPMNIPGMQEIRELYKICNTTMDIQNHCSAVAKCAMEISSEVDVKKDLLYIAALLHDVCRTEGRLHPQIAAKIIISNGYHELADIILQHHDLGASPTREAEILYLADKMIKGVRRCSLDERFEESLKKCKDEEALLMRQKRFDESKRLYTKYVGVSL